MSSVIRNLVEIPSHNLVENYKTHSSIYVLVAKLCGYCNILPSLYLTKRDSYGTLARVTTLRHLKMSID